jgi:hypothetical protein
MIKINLLFSAALLLPFAASPAHATTVPRAWVSGHGTDASGCGSPANPCRSFQYVHDNIVEAGGEIDVLDPAGYGALTITKAVSIVNDGVGTAGVQAGTAGQNAITINAGSSDKVILRGLNIDGLGAANNGILFNSGAELMIVNCVVQHFSVNGILIQPASGSVKFLISNTIVAENAVNGLQYYAQGNPTVNGVIDRLTATGNQNGITLDAGRTSNSSRALDLPNPNTPPSHFAISNSIASNNSNTGLLVQNGVYAISATVDLSTFSNNAYGVVANGQVVLLLGRCTVTYNTAVGVDIQSDEAFTFGNNQIALNGNDLSPGFNSGFALQ